MVAASAACYFSSTSASSSSSFSSFSSSSTFSSTFSYSFSSSAASPPFIRSDLGHQRRCPFIPPSIHANARLLIQAAFPSPITYKPCNFRQMPIPKPNYPLCNCFCSKRIHHLKKGECYLRQQLYHHIIGRPEICTRSAIKYCTRVRAKNQSHSAAFFGAILLF